MTQACQNRREKKRHTQVEQEVESKKKIATQAQLNSSNFKKYFAEDNKFD